MTVLIFLIMSAMAPMDNPPKVTGIIIFLRVMAFLVCFYVWLLMSLDLLSVNQSGLISGVSKFYIMSFTIDSVCLLLMMVMFIIRRFHHVNIVMLLGVFLAIVAAFVRYFDYRIGSSTFWFEPFLRGGGYVAAFLLFYEKPTLHKL